MPLKVIAEADSISAELKDAMVAHLRSLNIEVEDLGINSYYNIGAEAGPRVSSATTSPSVETRSLLARGTGVGVAIFANKFPGVFATTCLTRDEARNNRSINNCNVLALSGMTTPIDTAREIVDTWLNTPFKSPCPASKSQPWQEDREKFLDESMNEMPQIGAYEKSSLGPSTYPFNITLIYFKRHINYIF
ncbi:DNA damage-repair/toleration protein DRT102-like [Hibiscus syriacus]|uniref:DNA damage-repair/toleration protein DRT102-like n=1 Tax=Hibiscus syriacus TaxID=106335 RepID=UPI0019203C50|nr:DNA damage-repair/toleration protein DRT102-like [Hibiscus syriacus]